MSVYATLKRFMAMTILLVQGCMDWVEPSSFSQFTDFEQVAIPSPEMDMDKVVEAEVDTGPYRVVTGDVMDLTFPAVLSIETTQRLEIPNGMMTQSYRVSEQGTITLPVVGDILVAGRTLADIEDNVAEVYHATVAKERPPVFARINEYRTARVSVVGAVKQPGVYELRHDRMSLVALIMEAGGISEAGASVIRIVHQENITHSSSINYHPKESTLRPVLGRFRLSDSGLDDYPGQQPDPIPANLLLPPGLTMRFHPQVNSQTLGQLTVHLDDKEIASEWLDLNDARQRQTLTSRLADTHPILSPQLMDQELAQLPLMMNAHLNPQYSNMERIIDTPRDSQYVTMKRNIDSNLGMARYQKNEVINASRLASTSNENKRPYTSQVNQSIVLPIKGLNIPFKDVALYEGDRVTVEPLVMPTFTVLGLVNREGNFEYPPGESYNLMEAIGMAQGLDRTTDPRYAVIYRLMENGTIVHTCYDIRKPSYDANEYPSPMSVMIRPGDIVDIAHTPRTRTNALLQQLFRVSIGVYVPVWDTR